MSIQDILTGGGAAIVIMTLIQISPIKVDPWSAIARAIGRATNWLRYLLFDEDHPHYRLF